MGWGSVIGAGISAASSLLGASMSSKDAEKLARKQMDLQFQAQKELYQNRYQWATEDAMKAGLNPILTASQGPGSAGQVSALPVEAPDYSGALARGINSAIGILSAEADLANKEKQYELLDAQMHAQIDLGNMYRTQALVNNESAVAALRENSYWSAHPDMYKALQSGRVNVGVGTALQVLQELGLASRNWSRSGSKVLDRVDRIRSSPGWQGGD